MQEFIARLNMERFQQLIACEPDAAKRANLERMLADEVAKLETYRCQSAPAASEELDVPINHVLGPNREDASRERGSGVDRGVRDRRPEADAAEST